MYENMGLWVKLLNRLETTVGLASKIIAKQVWAWKSGLKWHELQFILGLGFALGSFHLKVAFLQFRNNCLYQCRWCNPLDSLLATKVVTEEYSPPLSVWQKSITTYKRFQEMNTNGYDDNYFMLNIFLSTFLHVGFRARYMDFLAAWSFSIKSPNVDVAPI